MIIVSQDKTEIVNFDNNGKIYIDEKKVHCTDTPGCWLTKLGEYKTKKRAKEVLQKIIQSYREYRTAEIDGYTNVLEETAVFEMPKE